MRTALFFILSAIVIAQPGILNAASDTGKGELLFYIVSQEKIDGSRYMDTVEFPKLGYIGTNADLVVTQLTGVHFTPPGSHEYKATQDKDGKITSERLPDRPQLSVELKPEDGDKLESLTGQNIGKRVLIMLGNRPLIVVTIYSPVSRKGFRVTLRNESEREKLKDELEKLVQ